jgi:serine/threonine-protein kinase
MDDGRIGSEIAGYRVLEQIGHGGTSVVYLAEHVRLGRKAALKLLAPAFGDADFSDRFVRESQLAAGIDHPAIVPVYDAGEAGGVLYIAMAHVEGSDLRALLREEGPLAPARALAILGQVAAALDAAHARGLVHRDVKPANILVGADDRAFLSDFGAVKELAAAGMTRTGAFLGTIEYAAPEQIEGKALDARTDVYALACVLYECLAGEPPFHRESEVAVLNAHLHAAPPQLHKAQPELPAALDTVVAKALSKTPLDRYASCGALVEAAKKALAPPPHVRAGRLWVSLAALAAVAAAGAALGFAAGHSTRTATATTVASTVTVSARGAPTNPHLLDSAGFELIGAGLYAQALPFQRYAVKALRGKGPKDPWEGYSNYNLARALEHLHRCREALPYALTANRLEPKLVKQNGLLKNVRRCAAAERKQ